MTDIMAEIAAVGITESIMNMVTIMADIAELDVACGNGHSRGPVIITDRCLS